MNNMNCNEKKKLMSLIQHYSFAVTEAVLYLDAHPKCRKAMNFYHKYTALRSEAIEMYEQKYGPLTMYGNKCEDSWKWVSEPWPWECDDKWDGRK